jgi:hypothetical protein
VKRDTEYGYFSIAFGFIAVLFSFISIYADSIYCVSTDKNEWFVFSWFEKFGLINHTAMPPEITEASIFLINEPNAIYLSYCIAVISACCAMVASFVAESKHDQTLLYSAGYICSVVGLLLINVRLGLLSAIIGFTIIMSIRNKWMQTLTLRSRGTPQKRGAP